MEETLGKRISARRKLDDVKSGNFGLFEELLKQYDNVVLKKKF